MVEGRGVVGWGGVGGCVVGGWVGGVVGWLVEERGVGVEGEGRWWLIKVSDMGETSRQALRHLCGRWIILREASKQFVLFVSGIVRVKRRVRSFQYSPPRKNNHMR